MQTTTTSTKVYVRVRADFSDDGTMFPREITWEDGKKYVYGVTIGLNRIEFENLTADWR